MSTHWSVDDIPWDNFRADLVDKELVKIVKAAALVESNADDYASYLCNVFHDDLTMQKLARDWAVEEVQHGAVLGRWAKMADAAFDYDARFQRFRDGYSIEVESDQSVRGSRSGELIARCMVEVGTSSYYTAIAEASEEPVLREVCRRIATDEWRHYAMFYKALKRYLEVEQPSRLRRLRIAVSRIAESEDDELAYAFYAANDDEAPYERKRCAKEYLQRAMRLYRPQHVERAMAMVLKAVGFEPRGRINRTLTKGFTRFMEIRLKLMA